MSQPSTSHGGRSFPCDRCGNIFSYDNELYIHQRHECPRRRLYSCRLCHDSFRNQSSLQQHMDMCHDTYICDRCPFRCHDRPTFLYHMQRHHHMDRRRRTFRENEYPSHQTRRRSQRIRKNVGCFLCNRINAEGINRRAQSHASVAEVRVRIESNSISEVSIKLEPHTAEQKAEPTRGDLDYWEHVKKTLLVETPELLRMWWNRTYETPFPSGADSQ